MADAKPPELSVFCQEQRHEQCFHTVGQGSSILGILRLGHSAKTFQVLCPCECHRECPIAGRWKAPTERWLTECSCPGAQVLRERATS